MSLYHPLSAGCLKIEGVDDAAEFRDVLSAMNTLQFSSSTVESMLKAIAGILLLGASCVCGCVGGCGWALEWTYRGT